MSILGFVKAFFRTGTTRPRHSGDELAENIKEATGPSVGGESGGGYAGYKFVGQGRQQGYQHLEDD